MNTRIPSLWLINGLFVFALLLAMWNGALFFMAMGDGNYSLAFLNALCIGLNAYTMWVAEELRATRKERLYWNARN